MTMPTGEPHRGWVDERLSQGRTRRRDGRRELGAAQASA